MNHFLHFYVKDSLWMSEARRVYQNGSNHMRDQVKGPKNGAEGMEARFRAQVVRVVSGVQDSIAGMIDHARQMGRGGALAAKLATLGVVGMTACQDETHEEDTMAEADTDAEDTDTGESGESGSETGDTTDSSSSDSGDSSTSSTDSSDSSDGTDASSSETGNPTDSSGETGMETGMDTGTTGETGMELPDAVITGINAPECYILSPGNAFEADFECDKLENPIITAIIDGSNIVGCVVTTENESDEIMTTESCTENQGSWEFQVDSKGEEGTIYRTIRARSASDIDDNPLTWHTEPVEKGFYFF